MKQGAIDCVPVFACGAAGTAGKDRRSTKSFERIVLLVEKDDDVLRDTVPGECW